MTIIKSLTFDDLRHANVQRNKEWDPDNKLTATFRATELAGELGEVCNIVKKLERARLGIPGSRVTFWELAQEMADVQITLDLLGMHYSVDIAASTRLKFNTTSEKMGLVMRL